MSTVKKVLENKAIERMLKTLHTGSSSGAIAVGTMAMLCNMEPKVFKKNVLQMMFDEKIICSYYTSYKLVHENSVIEFFDRHKIKHTLEKNVTKEERRLEKERAKKAANNPGKPLATIDINNPIESLAAVPNVEILITSIVQASGIIRKSTLSGALNVTKKQIEPIIGLMLSCGILESYHGAYRKGDMRDILAKLNIDAEKIRDEKMTAEHWAIEKITAHDDGRSYRKLLNLISTDNMSRIGAGESIPSERLAKSFNGVTAKEFTEKIATTLVRIGLIKDGGRGYMHGVNFREILDEHIATLANINVEEDLNIIEILKSAGEKRAKELAKMTPAQKKALAAKHAKWKKEHEAEMKRRDKKEEQDNKGYRDMVSRSNNKK